MQLGQAQGFDKRIIRVFDFSPGIVKVPAPDVKLHETGFLPGFGFNGEDYCFHCQPSYEDKEIRDGIVLYYQI